MVPFHTRDTNLQYSFWYIQCAMLSQMSSAYVGLRQFNAVLVMVGLSVGGWKQIRGSLMKRMDSVPAISNGTPCSNAVKRKPLTENPFHSP
jgi:hypothetical protein